MTQERRSHELIYAADFDSMNGLVGYLTENCCAGSGASCAPPGEQCVPVSTVKKTKRSTRAA